MSRVRWKFLLGLSVLGGFLGLLVVLAVLSSQSFAPREWARYVERRASGHNALIEGVGALMGSSLRALDAYSPSALSSLPNWIGAHPERSGRAPAGRIVDVVDEASLREAMARAEPGDVLTLLPGEYRIPATLSPTRSGLADRPIVVRAERLGSVILLSETREAFKLMVPHWQFENLVLRGLCDLAKGALCEHAFHVTGAALGFRLVNSRLEDFDAHVKINGEGGRFPDVGRIEGNTLLNHSARKTRLPVTSVDLVGASGWLITRNLVADFVKSGGDGISYGMFAKGAGRANRFESNLVVCEAALVGLPGQRVGLSFGGGGTSPDHCRDQRCVVEQEAGQMLNNLVTRCSDRGIYLNSAANSSLLHNTVIDTAGVTIRYPESSARLRGNLIDGPLSVRDDAVLHDEGGNRSQVLLSFFGLHPVRTLFLDADALRFEWRSAAPAVIESDPVRAHDLCGTKLAGDSVPGAFQDVSACLSVGR